MSSSKSITDKFLGLRLAFSARTKLLGLKSRLFSSSSPPDPVRKDALTVAIELGKFFSEISIEYAVGGSLALSLWSTPRATADADMNVFPRREEIAKLVDSLSKRGNTVFVEQYESTREVSRDEALRIACDYQEIHIISDGIPVDIFLPRSLFEMLAKVRKKKIIGINKQSVFFLDAETIVVYKLLWLRPKDLADVDTLFQVYARNNQTLDIEYIQEMLLQFHDDDGAGSTDKATLVLQKLCARYPSVPVKK